METTMETTMEKDKEMETIQHPYPNKILLLENSRHLFTSHEISLHGKLCWHYMITLCKNLDQRKFFGFFNKTMDLYTRFRENGLKNGEIMDYFRRCLFLCILEYIVHLKKEYSFMENKHLIKITPSKNGKKMSCLLDDSSKIDENNQVIGETDGTENNPHRGHKLFTSFGYNVKNQCITSFFESSHELKEIFEMMNSNTYPVFDPIQTIMEMVHYAKEQHLVSFMNLLTSEISDVYYTLSFSQQIELFSDEETLYSLWNTDFITNNQGKYRLFVLCLTFLTKIKK